jgi:hypothetical protein
LAQAKPTIVLVGTGSEVRPIVYLFPISKLSMSFPNRGTFVFDDVNTSIRVLSDFGGVGDFRFLMMTGVAVRRRGKVARKRASPRFAVDVLFSVFVCPK